jgi:hypothetical protein
MQFDQVELPAAAVIKMCALCRTQITDTYYEAGGAVLCPSCSDKLTGRTSGATAFPRALLYGAGAAVAGTIVWFIIGQIGYELGIIAIAVGFFVGRAVRVGSGGRGGWKYQALAMGLTYASICTSYVLAFVRAREGEVGGVAGLASAFGQAFAAPFTAGASNAIGILIIGIALYEAWKLNKPIPVSGPFRMAAAAAGAPVGPAPGSP